MATPDITKSPDYPCAVETITGLARDGFSEIHAIAALLSHRIEHIHERPIDENQLYAAITAIACKAQHIEELIVWEAEEVGIKALDPLAFRRGDSRV